MKAIQVVLPDELDMLLNAISHDKQEFIIASIRERLQKIHKKKIDKLMEEGYKSSRKDAKQFIKEFDNIDLEHWDEY